MFVAIIECRIWKNVELWTEFFGSNIIVTFFGISFCHIRLWRFPGVGGDASCDGMVCGNYYVMIPHRCISIVIWSLVELRPFFVPVMTKKKWVSKKVVSRFWFSKWSLNWDAQDSSTRRVTLRLSIRGQEWGKKGPESQSKYTVIFTRKTIMAIHSSHVLQETKCSLVFEWCSFICSRFSLDVRKTCKECTSISNQSLFKEENDRWVTTSDCFFFMCFCQ